MTDIATQEPTVIQAGDTLTWQKSYADYPANDSWVLHYRIINTAGKFDITSTASGADHLVTATAAATATYTAGIYTLLGWVTKASERYSVYSGKAEVLPDLAAQAAGYDNRTTAKKVLDLLDAAMIASGANAWTQSYTIEGRTISFRSPGDFIAYRSKIKQEVAREENADRMRNGLATKNRISVRF